MQVRKFSNPPIRYVDKPFFFINQLVEKIQQDVDENAKTMLSEKDLEKLQAKREAERRAKEEPRQYGQDHGKKMIERQQTLAALKENAHTPVEVEDQEATFTPMIISRKEGEKPRDLANFINDQYDYLNNSNAKIQGIRDQEEFNKSTAVPQTDPNSTLIVERTRLDNSVFSERLYNHSKKPRPQPSSTFAAPPAEVTRHRDAPIHEALYKLHKIKETKINRVKAKREAEEEQSARQAH